jgi:hypothetical protein
VHANKAKSAVLNFYENKSVTKDLIEWCFTKISHDEGKTWSPPVRLVYTVDRDCGYSSSVQLSDGKMVTAYYAKQSKLCDHCHMDVVIWDSVAR